MPLRPPDLPDYDDPPVIEVALSVQFEPLKALRTPHLGLLWERYRERFPRIEEQAPLPRVFETFGGQPEPGPPFRLQLVERPEPPRVWFLNDAQTELVQIQQDRFARNWRRLDSNEPYPRYEPIRDSFLTGLDTLNEFVRSMSLGEIIADQCEVTYINRITSEADEDLTRDLSRAVRIWNDIPSPVPGTASEDSRFATRYLMKEGDEPIGRLMISGGPARSSEDRPIVLLTLTARGKPLASGRDGVARFLDAGRATIVHAFTAITTDEMHRRWKRRI